MLVNADFHVHSCFSMATSKDMVIKNMAPKSKLKGLQLLELEMLSILSG